MAPELTEPGQQLVSRLASRTGFSPDAVKQLLMALQLGNGAMAQFSHPEFGGSGQWARGGMVMLGDMFNSELKARVDGLANELASAIATVPGLVPTGGFQAQSQGDGAAAFVHSSAFFVADPQARWYPAELGTPSSSGSQNSARYAYFADQRRLAVDAGGDVSLYDTLDHRISGFGQQHGGNSALTFTSQHGTVNLSALPLARKGGLAQAPMAAASEAPRAGGASHGAQASIFESIAQLSALKDKGILTEAEFAAKKAELLARI